MSIPGSRLQQRRVIGQTEAQPKKRWRGGISQLQLLPKASRHRLGKRATASFTGQWDLAVPDKKLIEEERVNMNRR